ncbi:septum formation initiator family protein [Lutimonas halocynthiae]|uniref:FtsB family cell division protein n=1 Tax=Lutimonas halocynthiae TaxID=1446477 RepID=UPI0025B5DAF6|nr:septum formation initiator family protein [Lutimonas halocynthiae]MDN3644376.1 septum formation initiator family protein [Lutimonas halocynthiae]
MNLKQLRENKVFRFLSNKYVIVLVLFIVWMGFFDENSFLNQRELDEEIDKLENANEYYKKQIDADQKIIDNLNDPDSLERYAREEYKMKRDNEDIFIIEYDTIEED